ncbi:amino acid transporter AVT6C-like isoform X2 [Nicotiana tomentosiformis]|uniref:amino acid transporter AVT6C-like isoform X2 n=1 Tax=Nicotiana tomentosiformis TaxID=4098 RepID=UPI00051BBBCC
MGPVKNGTGADVPLLGEKSSPTRENRRVIWRTVFNVSTSIIGAGIMSVPATMKVLGVIPAFLLIVLVAILVDISVDFMLRFTYAGQSTTYAGLMKENFGKTGSFAVQICVMITTLGCLIMYLIIIESLWFSSAIAVILAIVFVGICSVMAMLAIIKGETVRPRMLPELKNTTSFFNLFTVIPVIVTAFTFHFNVHPIGIELGKPTTMTTAVKISLAFCAAIYFSIGIFGYVLFGDSIMPDILVNFDKSSSTSAISPILNDVVRLSYALHLMLVFPLLNFSLRANIDELIFSKQPYLATDNKRFVCLTLILLALSYIAAIVIPSIWYIFQFLGSTSNVCLAFIFPGTIALRDVHGLSTRKDKIIAVVMVFLAFVTSFITIATNIYSMTRNSS